MSAAFFEILKLCPSLTPFLSAKQANEVEQYTILKLGIPSLLLMENAGLETCKLVLCSFAQMPKKARQVAMIFCGAGNNGGDALVCARHLLAHEVELIVCLVNGFKKVSPEQKKELDLLTHIMAQNPKSYIKIVEDPDEIEPDLTANTIILDGIFGAGLNRAPEGASLKAINQINELRDRLGECASVLAIDVPSGCTLEATPPVGACVRANKTITFGLLKRCHVSEPSKIFMGLSLARDIGLFLEHRLDQFLIEPENSLWALFKPLVKTSNKGNFGHVAVIEGHRNFKGASRLSARAALRAGAGLLTIVTKDKESLHPSDLPEFMKRFIEDADENFWSKVDTLVLGPGLGAFPAQLSYAKQILDQALLKVPTLVLDADGLKILNEKKPLRCETLICTPHPKEAAGILGISVEEVERDRFLAIERLGRLKIHEGKNTIWVLKGATTLVHQCPTGIFAFKGDVPILATGGSGDVLSGTISGLMAQAVSPLAATVLGVQVTIRAALEALRTQSRGILPHELSDMLPSLLKRPVG